jgi:hypothetical protein
VALRRGDAQISFAWLVAAAAGHAGAAADRAACVVVGRGSSVLRSPSAAFRPALFPNDTPRSPDHGPGCGYNSFQTGDEQIKASWSEVLNQYQRRADLVPNLVSDRQGRSQLRAGDADRVIEARAKATSVQATPELVNNPEAFQKFQAAQGELSAARCRGCWW